MSRRELESAIEAILFVAREPVPRKKLLSIFDARDRDEANRALAVVIERYRERASSGIMIDEVAGGVRLVTRPDLHGYLRRFYEASGSSKMSMAALETLAIVAYRQPVTAPEIQELRGVSSSGVLKTLLERRLIRVAGRKEVVGKPFLYATTREFLMHFGLDTLKELPPLEQFEELLGVDEPDEPAEDDHEEIALQEAAVVEEAAAEEEERLEDEAIEAEREAAEAAADEEIDDDLDDDDPPVHDSTEPVVVEAAAVEEQGSTVPDDVMGVENE
ncbi:MAG: SMC-Scp complex subunit ScpB [Acidobacteriota bacterium]